VSWYGGGNGRFALLPPTKIITYEEGGKAGICKVSKKLKEKIDKRKPLSSREHTHVEFLNDMNTSKQDRIAKCIARARKIPLQPPAKATTQTQAGMDQESNPKKCTKNKAADTWAHAKSPKKSKPNGPVQTEEDQVVITPDKLQQLSTEKNDNTLRSSHTAGFREQFLLSLAGGNQKQEEDPSQLYQQIYDLIGSNYAILYRVRGSMKTGSTIGPETTFVRSYFNKVKIVRSMEMIKFVTTPVVEDKTFCMQSLQELPSGLDFFSSGFFMDEGLIDFEMFLDYSQLMEERVRSKILHLLKCHVRGINTHLREIESWVLAHECPINFFRALFNELGRSGFTEHECILAEKRLEPNVQSFIKGLRLREWEVDEEYDLSVDDHLNELMGIVNFVTA
jgi:hypothetical protein